jgi:hypothetical protein
VAILAAVVIFAAGIGQTSAGHAVLRTAGLSEESAGYTSLAFLHPLALPQKLPSRRAKVDVSFVIRNSGGDMRSYRWSVVLTQAGRTSSQAAGDVKIESGRDAAITRPAEISCAQGRVRIAVRLARPVETIDAWATCWSPGS